MKILFKIITFLLGLAAIGVGMYYGIWVMFVGGIANIIDIIQAPPVIGIEVAKSVAMIILFELPMVLGWFVGAALIGFGTAMD